MTKSRAPKRRGKGRPSPPLDKAAVLAELCTRIAGGRTLAAVCRDPDMPSVDAVCRWMREEAWAAEMVARARSESAHGLAMSAVEIADRALAGEFAGVQPQLVRNACDQRRWLAGKYNAAYSDRVALTDADGGSLVQRIGQMTMAERRARLLALAERAKLIEEDEDDDGEGPALSTSGVEKCDSPAGRIQPCGEINAEPGGAGGIRAAGRVRGARARAAGV